MKTEKIIKLMRNFYEHDILIGGFDASDKEWLMKYAEEGLVPFICVLLEGMREKCRVYYEDFIDEDTQEKDVIPRYEWLDGTTFEATPEEIEHLEQLLLNKIKKMTYRELYGEKILRHRILKIRNYYSTCWRKAINMLLVNSIKNIVGVTRSMASSLTGKKPESITTWQKMPSDLVMSGKKRKIRVSPVPGHGATRSRAIPLLSVLSSPLLTSSVANGAHLTMN